MSQSRPSVTVPLSLAAAAALSCAACVQNSSPDELFFSAVSTKQSVTQNTRIVIQERWLAYLADELTTAAGGTDFNADGDVNDQIAVLVNMATRKNVVLDTQADDVALVGSHLFLVTDEAKDDVDWNGDGDSAAPDDLVLLHVVASTATPGTLAYVATLSRAGSGPRIFATDNRLFFEDVPAVPLVAPETTLEYVTASSPTTPVRVMNADLTQTAQPHLMALDEKMLFTELDENDEGRDVNGDADTTDSFVLALIDTTATTPKVREVGLALASATSPVRAFDRANGDWVVAFLVDEAAQGGVTRNNANTLPPSWRPSHCTGPIDNDATDQVLAYLVYTTWAAGNSNPVNTGFAGTNRVLATASSGSTFVATICPEGDDGNCTVNSLNNDGDFTDDILRWIKVETPLGNSGIFADESGLVALADTPGGTHGATDLDGRFLTVVDENFDDRDHDGQIADHQIVGWLDPADGNSAVWEFDHGTGAGIQASGASWMGERAERDRLLVAFEEAVYGLPINSSDNDLTDSVPTFVRFDPGAANDLDFPGPAVAVSAANAGIVIGNGSAFYRVDENADNRNWNGDNDKNDKVLFRTNANTIDGTIFISTLNNLNRPAVEVGRTSASTIGAAFIADESQQNSDFNNDGDTNDFVLRWIRIG